MHRSEHSQVESCSVTGLPLCRRAFNINLALGYTEELFALKVLAERFGKSMDEFFDFVYGYIEARDCFKKEWVKMKSIDECPLINDCVSSKCFSNEKNNIN